MAATCPWRGRPGPRPAAPAPPRRLPDLGRSVGCRHPPRGPVRGRPGDRARPARTGAPRGRPAPPGRRAGRPRRARPPGPRAPRLGDPGALQHDPDHPEHRAAAHQGPAAAGERLADVARPAARRPGRDARAHLRAASRRARAGRARGRPPAPGDGRPEPGRAAGRRGGPARRAAVERDRGLPLPDRPGGAPQRRQARRGPHRAAASSGACRTGVRIAVIDDGAGFDAATVPPGHLGLAGMRARAERIGGRFKVESQPGKGTTIEVVVPA